MDLYLNRLLRCLILYLSSSLLVCCIFTTDSNQEMILCFFPHYLMTQDSCHFPLQGCISFISYNGIPLNLSMKCLLQFVLLQFCLFLQKPCGLHRKPVTELDSFGRTGLFSYTQDSLWRTTCWEKHFYTNWHRLFYCQSLLRLCTEHWSF